MNDLIARLEDAPEGSEVLDVAICRAICNYGPDDPLWHVLPYTRQFESATALVPEGWIVAGLRNGDLDNRFWRIVAHDRWRVVLAKVDQYVEMLPIDWRTQFPEAWGATPALALCIAALRARLVDRGGEVAQAEGEPPPGGRAQK